MTMEKNELFVIKNAKVLVLVLTIVFNSRVGVAIWNTSLPKYCCCYWQ